jgi:predicted phage terminase large subunit-like protein
MSIVFHEKQSLFARSSADIAIYGGGAGGGKTIALSILPLQYIDHDGFSAGLFRRTYPEIKQAHGLWDNAIKYYPMVGGFPRESDLSVFFRTSSGGSSSIKFNHIEHEESVKKYAGVSFAWLGFDELQTFSENMFFSMIARNRSIAPGVPAQIRATCNPDSESWLRKFIDWYIGEDGYPIKERIWKLLYFVRPGDKLEFDTNKERLAKKFSPLIPKSMTFIPALLSDNKTLERSDPNYKASLMSLLPHDRERLLGGNWNVTDTRNRVFFNSKIANFSIERPVSGYLDVAFTDNKTSDFSSLCIGYKVKEKEKNNYYIVSGQRHKGTLDKVYDWVYAECKKFNLTILVIESNNGGQAVAIEMRKRGLNAIALPNTKNKQVRIQTYALNNWDNIFFSRIVSKDWINQLEGYTVNPPPEFDDVPDSLAGLIESFDNVGKVIGQYKY